MVYSCLCVCVCVNVESRNSFRLYINTYVQCRVPRSLLMYWGRTRLLHRLRSYYGDCGLLCVCYERLNVLLWRHGLGIDMMILLKEKVEDKNNALENIYILCAYGRRRGGVVGGGGGWGVDVWWSAIVLFMGTNRVALSAMWVCVCSTRFCSCWFLQKCDFPPEFTSSWAAHGHAFSRNQQLRRFSLSIEIHGEAWYLYKYILCNVFNRKL